MRLIQKKKKGFYNSWLLNRVPNTIRMGLQELEHNYQKMANSSVADEKFVLQINTSIKTFVKVLEEAIGKDGNNKLIIQQIESIEDAISFINHSVSNRLQASRYLFEAKTFNPLNIGAFSKLYLFYESLIDLFERIIARYSAEMDDDGIASDLSFLVDISVHSSVNAKLFVPVVSNKQPSARFIGVTINEHSFFHIKDTVRLLLHEIGHYVRPYKREKRNKLVLQITLKWICLQIEGYLADLLYKKFFNTNGHDKIRGLDLVRSHFEVRVFPVLNNIIYSALEAHFEYYIESNKARTSYSKNDVYQFILHDFGEFVFEWISNLNESLRRTLYLNQPEDNKLSILITEAIKENLEKGSDYTEVTITGNPLHLYGEANSLLQSEKLFENDDNFGNVKEEYDEAFKAYINSLSLLGLNEYNGENVQKLVAELIKQVKVNLEIARDSGVLDTVVNSMDEALADLFMIKAIDIKSIVEYQELIHSYTKNLKFSDLDLVEQFGFRNAIMTEYFLLTNSDTTKPLPHYSISPIPLTGKTNENIFNLFRTIFFLPIAKYLTDEQIVFPEAKLFRQSINEQAKSDSLSILMFRNKFREYYSACIKNEGTFESEIKLINIFNEVE